MPLIDYLILAPLQQEWTAARGVLPPEPGRVRRVPDGSLTYRTWTQPVATRQYEGEYLVAATPMDLWTPGGEKAAAVAANALARWHPSRLVLVGIAGSITPDTVRLGDVVVAAQVYGYGVSEAHDGGEVLRPTFHQPGAIDLNRAVTFQDDDAAYEAWRAACLQDADTHGLGSQVKDPPKLHLGVIASGNRVVKSKAFGERLKQEINKYIVAVEMEAMAVHQAVYVTAGRTDALTVRGISDYADPDKERLEKASNDGWRTWAAANAARLVRSLLEYGVTAPLSPSYHLDLRRGQRDRFGQPGVPRFAYKHVGSQDVAFPWLLRRGAPTPELTLRVAATMADGSPAQGSVGVCLTETPGRAVVHGTPQKHGGLGFVLPPSAWGMNAELLLSFPQTVRQIAVSCEDDFGRAATASLDLSPPTPRGTP